MSILSSLRTYLANYTGLKAGAPLWVDNIGPNTTEYAIIPLPGSKIIENYVDGSSLREYPFAFQSMESTADDLERLENNGFFELLGEWMESQTAKGILPILGSGKTAEAIETSNWGFLFEQGDSATGVYQVTCRLIYKQQP